MDFSLKLEHLHRLFWWGLFCFVVLFLGSFLGGRKWLVVGFVSFFFVMWIGIVKNVVLIPEWISCQKCIKFLLKTNPQVIYQIYRNRLPLLVFQLSLPGWEYNWALWNCHVQNSALSLPCLKIFRLTWKWSFWPSKELLKCCRIS